MVSDLLSDKLIFYITNFKKRLETILEAKSEVLQKISSLQNEQNKKTSTRNAPLVKFKLK
ncbi:hypothetical protein BBP08_11675 [Streptococcus agalactiae]|nr:hypothetical protein CFK58_10190 [Streptococcus agalactiae]OZV78047.1 hypothetical protein CFK60_10490 [Streptococcus agalactiae]PWO04828.1 hypothetical protein DEF86_03175 [Streptococcus agalactiae]PWO04929.1 hypothetical protein DEF93_00380 [Streptococcus agalactiae]QAY22061.1 hypothetical protein BBP08_11675 [Streptococcus agalactiae]